MSRMKIENDCISVAITPAYGARVVSLIDKANGREWMTQGAESPLTGEEVVYLGDEAIAWDECFPTVGRYDAAATPWGRNLRDHGDIWGRPWTVVSSEAGKLALSYADAQFRFARELRLDGRSLIVSYAVTNLTGEPLPYLWALHALLAVEAGDRIELPADTVSASFVALDSQVRSVPGGRINWSGENGVLPFSLDEVQPRSTTFAGKFILDGAPGASARVGRDGQWLEIAWDESIADLGIWLTYGGWPAPGGHQEIALEPTSAPADHLGQAIAANARPLAPGETRNWQVTLTVGS